MNKKTIKVISAIITMLIVMMFVVTPVFAEDYTPNSVTKNTAVNGAEKVKNIGGDILGFIQIAGTLISVGVIMVLGIKYMMGSAEEKASYKKTMIPYLVGAALLFAASNLANVIYNFASTI